MVIYFFHLYFVDLERTTLEKLPGPFDTYSIGVFRHPIVHLRNIPGFQNSAFNKYLHNHTLFLTNVNKLTYEQQQAYGIMSMFGSLVSMAMDNGVKMGEHLETPFVIKCVVTDGVQFTLMCYQLNTLSFREDSGIKNCAWASDSMNLFEKTASKVRPIPYEILDAGDAIPHFNDECLKSIPSFNCQETESGTEL